ncbi:MAG TPA: (Fe-S)-binding protein [Labilithrix sp.]
MARPGLRPMRALPLLEPRRGALEKCVFCPKLCRSACPVSNADTRETVTPWGKMSMSYFVANGSVEAAPSFAAPAWACTGCFGCREHCDHENDVTGTLFDSRSALVESGLGPEPARNVLQRFDGKTPPIASVDRHVDAAAGTALLVGCAYGKHDAESRDAVRATTKLTGGKVALVDVCCGAPLLYAGDKTRFRQQGEMLAQAVKHREQLVVVDAGCAAAIRVHHANAGVGMIAPVVHFAELAARALGDLGRVELGPGPVRWHDPCQLGRGIGVYDQPRAVLARAIGRTPDEFERRREDARCSGAGGLLPLTMPDVARAIAKQRLDDHGRSGGGTVVTACASSLRSFRKEGATAIDLVSVVARALGC